MKLCGHPKIDVERELSFLNLIVVRNHDAKISVSFVTCCGVSVLLSSFALFVFKVRFRPNVCDQYFQKPFALAREIKATKISR